MGPVRSLLYALGVVGYSIADRLAVVLLLYFYLPPAGRGLPVQVPEKPFWGVLTAFGVAMGAGRLVDALSDLLVGYASDRSRSRFGRRRAFMLWAVVPMSALPVAAFWPPGPPGSAHNAVYLGALLVGFFAAFTSYVAPLLALLPEIESETRGRARLSTLVGAANLLGLLAFTPLAFAGVDALRAGTGAEPVQAMRGVAVASGALALVLCALPIAAVDERRLAVRTGPSALGFGRAVRETLARPAFLIFAAGQVFLVLATHMAAPLPAYLATAVLGRSESFASLLSLVLLAAALGGFALVPRAAARLGARRALVCACLLAAPCLAAWGALRPVAPGAPSGALNLWIAFGSLAVLGIAVAGFAVLPYLLIGQLIDADRARTQTSRSAMFFGIQGLLLKWVYGAGSALLAYLFARYGNSAAQPGGVLVAGPIAALCCVAAAGGFALYPERDVLRRARSAPAE